MSTNAPTTPLHRRTADPSIVHGWATRLLDAQGQQRAMMVHGDLNDETHAATTTLLQGPPDSEIGAPGFDPTRATARQPLIW